jgi:hypothetical protein
MCDVDNPLCCPSGAAAIFGPQKGADEAMIGRLDAGLAHLAEVIRKDLGLSVAEVPGAGAAGGMGAGCIAFLDARLKSGIEAVLDTVDYQMRGELIAYSEFFDRYRETVVSEVSGAINDTYLKLQGTEGSKSYGRVVDLAVAWYKSLK